MKQIKIQQHQVAAAASSGPRGSQRAPCIRPRAPRYEWELRTGVAVAEEWPRGSGRAKKGRQRPAGAARCVPRCGAAAGRRRRWQRPGAFIRLRAPARLARDSCVHFYVGGDSRSETGGTGISYCREGWVGRSQSRGNGKAAGQRWTGKAFWCSLAVPSRGWNLPRTDAAERLPSTGNNQTRPYKLN